MYILGKIIQRCLAPLPLGILSLVLILIFASRKPRFVKPLALFGLLILIPPSMPIVAHQLMASLEAYAPSRSMESLPARSAIVVLGGTTGPQWGQVHQAEELADSRLLTALRLYRFGKSQKIVVTSGVKYQTENGVWRTEAEDMRDILISMDVAETAILLETQARNTAENARFSAEIVRALGAESEPDIYLVSSAYHLRRASRWFQIFGFNVSPIGTGRIARPGHSAVDFIPSATALSRSSAAIKEYLGMIPILLGRVPESKTLP